MEDATVQVGGIRPALPVFPTPPFTTSSMSSVTSSPVARCGPSGPQPWQHGMLPRPHDPRRDRCASKRVASVAVTRPVALLRVPCGTTVRVAALAGLEGRPLPRCFPAVLTTMPPHPPLPAGYGAPSRVESRRGPADHGTDARSACAYSFAITRLDEPRPGRPGRWAKAQCPRGPRWSSCGDPRSGRISSRAG